VQVLAIDGSPQGGGRTETVLREVLCGAEEGGATTALLSLAAGTPEQAIDAIERADAVVFGSPVYRASFVFPLKRLLDELPRGMWGETRAPLQGKAVALVMTSASPHHFLALDDLRNVLAGFFAAHIVPPGLAVSREAFTEDRRLDDDAAGLAVRQGMALVELSRALGGCPTLRSLVAQA
jgi:FMN reductase